MIAGSPGAAGDRTTAPAPSPNSTHVDAIGVVDDARHDVGADDERVLAGAGRDHLIRDAQRVGEPGTRGAEVEAPRVDRADLRLQRARRARKNRVRRRRADDDEADVVGREAGFVRWRRAPPAPRCPTSRRRDRRCAARGCPCAAGSTRRRSRPSSRDRSSSARAAGRTSTVPRSSPVVNPATTDVPFPEPSVRSIRTPAPWRRARARCDRGSRSG